MYPNIKIGTYISASLKLGPIKKSNRKGVIKQRQTPEIQNATSTIKKYFENAFKLILSFFLSSLEIIGSRVKSIAKMGTVIRLAIIEATAKIPALDKSRNIVATNLSAEASRTIASPWIKSGEPYLIMSFK